MLNDPQFVVEQVRGPLRIVDRGRKGFRKLGIPLGGFADVKAGAAANLLVHNLFNEAAFEFELAGPKIRFLAPVQFAITGALVSAELNHNPIRSYQTYSAKDGDVLDVTKVIKGCRGYIAFRGGLICEKWFESCSACLLGTESYPLTSLVQSKDSFRIGHSVHNLALKRYMNPSVHLRHQKIRFRLGPDLVDATSVHRAVKQLFTQHWKIDEGSSRMGIRLKPYGKTNSRLFQQHNGLKNSAVVVPGMIQLIPSGGLIIAHVDGQTIGGYPRIGIIDQDGLDQLAQGVLGYTTLQFELIAD